MKVPVPPKVSSSRPAPPSNWWVIDHDVTITRTEFLARWRTEIMTISPTDRKAFNDEMDAWCRDLGARGWIAREYSAAATFPLRSPNAPYAEPAGWNAVSAIAASYIEPLAEYSSGWSHSMRQLRPRMRADAGRQLREMGRLVGRRIRDDLVATNAVADSRTLTDFIVDQSDRHPRHICLALQLYITHLRRFLRGLALKGEPNDHELRLILSGYHRDLIAAFENTCDAKASPGHEPGDEEVSPTPLTPGTSNSALISVDRLAGRSSVLGDDSAAGGAEAVLVSKRIADYARIRIARDPTLRRPHGDDMWWEARIASEIIGDPGLLRAGLDVYVVSRWGSQRPESARSASARQAVRDVRLLLHSAINYAKRLGGQ